MEKETLLKETREGVGTLTLNRPERHNALSPELLVRLHRTLQEWAEEGQVRALVIRGAGDKAFSSGYDILAIPTEVTPEMERVMKEQNPLALALESLKRFPYPSIAMLNGHCFGGALNLALCCDIRVGAEDIAVGMPAAKLGVVYPPDGLRQFVQVLGMAKTREIFFAGRTYRGREIEVMGLVDHLVPRSELTATTYGFASEIAANAPLALKGIKRILNLIEDSSALSDEALRGVQSLATEAFNSQDLKEGQAAFLEKRQPRFTGR